MIAQSRWLYTKAMQMLAAETRSLQRAVSILALFAILSSALALLRDRIFAHIFGASTTLDLYYAAFRIPDFLFVAMGALVSVYVLIPELSRRSDAEQFDYFDTVIAGFSILVVILCGAAALAAPRLLAVLFPQFVALGLMPKLTLLTRIMLLQPVFLGFSNVFGAITQLRHRYLLYALSPVLYNAGIIVGAVAFYPLFGIAGLALGVVCGAFLHGGIQLPSIIGNGFFRRMPAFRVRGALLATVAISIPRALALSMNQITFFGLTVLAGLLVSGSIAIFNFAFNLQAVPLAIIGASYSVAAFPNLASALAQKEYQRFIEQMSAAARFVVFWSLPATALIIVLRAHVVRAILGSGAFNWTDTRLVAAAFALFGISLAAQGVTLLIVRAYYAAGRTFTPFFIALGTAILTVSLGAASVGALNVAPVRHAVADLMRVPGVPGVPVLALAFAYAISSIIGTAVLITHFELRFGGFIKRVWRSWLEALAAAVATGGAAYLMLDLAGPISLSSTFLTVVLRGLAGAVGGVAAAAMVYYLLGSVEFRATVAVVRYRIPGFVRRRVELPPDIVAAAEEQTTI